MRRFTLRVALAGGQSSGGAHGRLEAQHRGHRRRGAVEGPVEPAEGDHRGAHGALGKNDHFAEIKTAVRRGTGERPEDDDIGADDEQHAPQHGPLAETGGFVLQRVQTRTTADEALEGPVDESE